MEIALGSLFFVGVLLITLIVVLVVINRQQQTTQGAVTPGALPQDAGPIYLFEESTPEIPTTIECSCESPIPVTLVGDMFDFNDEDDWGGAVITYRPEDNTIYVGSNSDTLNQMAVYPIPLDSFDFNSPSIQSPVANFAADIPFGSTMQGFAWNSTDGVFYTGRSNGQFYSISDTSPGVWTLVAEEMITEDSTRGYAVLPNGNMLVADSPSIGGNNIYEINPDSGDDPISAINTYSITYQGEDIEGFTAMTRAPDGSIWVAIRENNYDDEDPTPVLVFVPGQTALVQTCFVNSEYVISAMTFDGEGRLWFMTGGNDSNPTSIYFVDPPPCPEPFLFV